MLLISWQTVFWWVLEKECDCQRILWIHKKTRLLKCVCVPPFLHRCGMDSNGKNRKKNHNIMTTAAVTAVAAAEP